jgi:dTDP-4-amino-4,6-dideoxygalactose transaminase
LAELGLQQFGKLEKFNAHRIKIASIYQQELNIDYPLPADSKHIFLRFPVLVEDGMQLRNRLKSKRIILGDWYKSILYAPERSWKLLHYILGSAPVAENVARRIINLPTHINVSESEAKRIAQAVKQ